MGRRRVAPLVLVAALSLGCSQTKYVAAPATPASIEAAQADHPGVPVRVEGLLPSGQAPAELELVRATPELTIVKAGAGAPELSLANASVRRLSVHDRGQGALYGAGIGVLLAAAAVTTIVLAYECDPNTYICLDEPVPIAMLVGLPILALSTGVGALVGVRTTYVFQ